MILEAFKTVLTLVVLIGVGYLISELGWYGKENKSFLSHLIINVSIPAVIIKTFFQTFPRELLLTSGRMVILSIVSIFITYMASEVFAKILRLDKARRVSFTSVSTLSNCMFIGLPVASSIYGFESIPYVMIYYVVSVVLLWSFFAPKFNQDMDEGKSKLLKILEGLVSIPLVTLAGSLVLALIGFKMPKMVLTAADYLGNMSTPLSLIFIGGVIHEVGLKNMKADISTFFNIIVKFIIAPLTIVLLGKYMGLEPIAIKSFAIVAGMPPMTQLGVISSKLEEEGKYVMTSIGLLTLISLVFIPIYTVVVPIIINI